jgi:hypothetical protein
MSDSRVWIVTLRGDRSAAAVARDLAAAGIAVEAVLAAIGVITARAPAAALAAARAIPGIADIAPDQDMAALDTEPGLRPGRSARHSAAPAGDEEG